MTDAAPHRDTLSERPWHAVPGEDVAEDLGSDREAGLADKEAHRRLERYGPNRLPERQRETVLRTFLRQFRDPLIYILLIAGGVSLAIGNLAGR
ncbi:cation-transporting P-type ATPase [Rhodovulum sp. 12E13]|uniref:cation-transporting P-type ATPase n=1 Tax=Rhodovulum sp. 12E13 TaxID=2203891 RepID=UPI0013141392|nr:cation-transporting P-type ATPase [Rhodovulum sp. 12E13]